MAASTDGPDQPGYQKEAPGSSHQAPENQRRPRMANARQMDTLSMLSTVCDSSRTSSKFSLRLTPANLVHGSPSILEKDLSDHGGHDEIDEEEGDDDIFSEDLKKDSTRTICEASPPLTHERCGTVEQETMRTVCKQAARNIAEVLCPELCGSVQAAIREEVGRTIREEFRSWSRNFWEHRPRSIVIKSGQADHATTPTQLRSSPEHSDGSHPELSPPSHQTTVSSCPSLPVMPSQGSDSVAKVSSSRKPCSPMPGDEAGLSVDVVPPQKPELGNQDEVYRDCFRIGSQPRHHTSCGVSSTSSVSSGSNLKCGEEKSSVPAWQSSLARLAHQRLIQAGLVQYAVDLTAPQPSSPPQVSRSPRKNKKVSSAKPFSVLSLKNKSVKLRDLEQELDNELFRAEGLLSPKDDGKKDDTETASSWQLLTDIGTTVMNRFTHQNSVSSIGPPPPQIQGQGTEELSNVLEIGNTNTITTNDAASVYSIDAAQHAPAVAGEKDLRHSLATEWSQPMSACRLEGGFSSGTPTDNSKQIANGGQSTEESLPYSDV